MLRRRFLISLAIFGIYPKLASTADKKSQDGLYEHYLTDAIKLPNKVFIELQVTHTFYQKKRSKVKDGRSCMLSVYVPQVSKASLHKLTLMGSKKSSDQLVEATFDEISIYTEKNSKPFYYFDWYEDLADPRIYNIYARFALKSNGQFVPKYKDVDEVLAGLITFTNNNFGDKGKAYFIQKKDKIDSYEKQSLSFKPDFKGIQKSEFLNCKSVVYQVPTSEKMIELASFNPGQLDLNNRISRLSKEVKHEILLGAGHPYISACAITSAVCGVFGLKDNCFELRQLRNFRDRYVSDADILEYQKMSEAIIRHGYFQNKKAKRNTAFLYWQYILPGAILALFKADRHCYRLYKKMVFMLENKVSSQ